MDTDMREIQPKENQGNWRITFMYRGQRFSLSGFGRVEDDNAYQYCLEVCQKINKDISSNNFNCLNNAELSLKYNPRTIGKFLNNKIINNLEVNNLQTSKEEIIQKLKERINDKSTVSDLTTLNFVKNYPYKIENEKDAKSFVKWLSKNRKNSTVKRYLAILKQVDECFKAIDVKVQQKPIVKTYTEEELVMILTWFKNHRYYKNYFPFVYFLLSTGFRVSEAIGIRWKDVNLEENKIYIYESLARDGNNSSKRIRKETKTGKTRIIPINNQLKELLLSLRKEKEDDLIFKSPTGKCIDDHNFSQRIYKKCVEELKLYGSPKTLRQAFSSHFVKKTGDFVALAKLTHNSRSGLKTVIDNYAHLVSDESIPEFFSLD